jgi:predicted HTH domain antitoxin
MSVKTFTSRPRGRDLMSTAHSMPEHDVVHEDEAVREIPAPRPGTAADRAAGDDLDVLILEPDQYTTEDAPEPTAETVPDLVAEPTGATSEPATAQPTSTIFRPATAPPMSTTAEPDTMAEPPGALAEPDAMVGAISEPPDALADQPGGLAEPPDALADQPGALVEPPGPPPDDAFAADIPPTNPDYRWREIQVMFVDDPRGSVERAAELAADTLRELNTMLRERERDLRSTWQDTSADTEELRTSLQGYRALVAWISELAQQR